MLYIKNTAFFYPKFPVKIYKKFAKKMKNIENKNP